ncbi:phage tail sheath protein [Ammoniphilus oxalaticus]|uniref:Phage tail sheath protein n=1 Tax=Ammoniphilus oxalaticus TaxID=66863 RepID=A0A419SQI7_9BACL|nr:phage tail sheath C-terminal domain-containing protein [Ammoniphilus oxalaticus]RKD26685.1 phage tail sheath protein [Ammoniphilus oxalaticus]
MGLPQINIEFKGRAVTAVRRSQLGIVALILKDDTQEKDTIVYRSIEEVEPEEWSEKCYDYIEKAFRGTPSRVIVERLPEDADNYNEALKRLNSKRWNYLAIPQIGQVDTEIIASWIKSKHDNDKRTFKVVLPNVKGDHECILNFTAEEIVAEGKEYTTAEYTARVAGAVAGLPFTRSITYYEFPEIESIKEVEDPDAAIDAGELILINDGENIKIGRGVNSLTTTSTEKTEDFKSIRVIEVMHMIKDDIRETFDKHYVGKVNNIYDNQVLFITSVNAYFAGLGDDEILDPNEDNRADVDVRKQRLAWEEIGTDTSDWDDQEVKNRSFRRNVYLAGRIKIVDAMEDLDFNIAV